MKLLSYKPTFIKDASKAVKRICKSEFKKTVDNTLTELLGIATLSVTMYALRREGTKYCIFGVSIEMMLLCALIVAAFHRMSIKKKNDQSDT